MSQAVKRAALNRSTKNAMRNEREDMLTQMKLLLAQLLTAITDDGMKLKDKQAVYAGIQYKAATLLAAHNRKPGIVLRFRSNYFETLVQSFILDKLPLKDAVSKKACSALLPLMPLRFRIKCLWRRLWA